MFAAAFFLLVAFWGACMSADLDCTDLNDGNYGVTCKKYLKCDDGCGVVETCPHETMFNNDKGQCESPLAFNGECGVRRDCTGKGTGGFVDTKYHCRALYICLNDQFFGWSPCRNMLKGEKFIEEYQACSTDWTNDDVPPECQVEGRDQMYENERQQKIHDFFTNLWAENEFE